MQDALWLEMDRPHNLMVVDSVVWTSEPLDFDKVRAVVEERLINRYPVFRSRAVKDDDGFWCWEPFADFDFDDHVTVVNLKKPTDPRSLQAVVAAHRTEMLDRNLPLWQAIWVKRYRGGSAMILRTHHAIADGMRMVQLSMSLFDAIARRRADPGSGCHPARRPPASARAAAGPAHPRRRGRGRRHRTGGRHPRGPAVGAVADVPRMLHRAGEFGQLAVRNPLGAGHTVIAGAWATGSEVAASVRGALPGGGALVDVFSAAPGDVDTVRKLLIGTRNDATIWTGTAGDTKGVAWSEPVSLAKVKAVAKANNCTVNDVLVASVAGALHDYLTAHDARCASVTFMVPVNLKPLDLTLPETLGNEFALVQLELPTDEPDARRVLAAAKRRMNRIKHGHEAAVAFSLQGAIAGLSRGLYEASVDLFTQRTLGTLTNVPGPPIPVYLAGSRVEGIVGWAPVSGDQPMSFTISSYNGTVIVGIACDTTLVPDHESIVDGFAGAFERLVESTPDLPG